MEQTGKKEKDFALFEYDPTHEQAIKITFSGNIKLKNGYKGTILGVKGKSKDGNTKFIKIFSVIFIIGFPKTSASLRCFTFRWFISMKYFYRS